MAKIFWFCGHEQFQPEELVEHAVLAEKAGFDGVMVSEHFHPWVGDESAGGFAFSTLGAMAQATNKLELMTAVTTPLFRYHPALVAQAAATVDRLSDGRFSLGVGSGEMINEAPLGHHFPDYAERSARMEEALHIMRRLLGGEKLTHTGDYYKTSSAKLYSPPLSPIPILLAAGGPKSATLAGKEADGVITSVKDIHETRKNVIEPVRKAADGKKLTIVANRWTVYADDEVEAWKAIQPWRGLRAPDRDKIHDPEALHKQADALGKHKILERFDVIPTPEAMVAAYSPLISQLGADIVGIQSTSTDIPALITLLGREVVPKLKKVGGK